MLKNNDSASLEAKFQISIADVTSVVEVNGSIEELLGYCPNDFLSGKVLLADRIHSDDQDIAEEIYASEPTNISHTVNLRLRQSNGRIRCIKANYQKCTANDGNGIILDLLIQDAKSLKRTMDEVTGMVSFHAMMENTNDYIYFKDRNHVFTGASQTLVALCDPAEHWTDLLGQTDYDVFPEEYADIYYRLEKDVFSGVAIAHETQEYLSKEGKRGWVDNRKYPIRDEQGEIIGLYGIARDITDRILAEEALKKAVTSQNAILAAIPDLMLELDEEGRYLNAWAQNPEELAHSKEHLIGRTVSEMLPADAAQQVMAALKEAEQFGQSHGQQIQLTTPNGELWFELSTSLEDGNVSPHRFIMLSRNITKRKRMEAELRYLSKHDPLTKLFNRRALMEHLDEELLRADRYHHPLSIFMLDIDHFKPINDTFGHRAGDAVLCSLARVLESSTRETDYVSRYGGEEFIIILPETHLAKACEMAERLRITVAGHPIPIGDKNVLNITVSIGISTSTPTFPEHADSGRDLLNAADSAMYLAKNSGRNCVKVAKKKQPHPG
jgi:diguanylate cyclase (GGDEF)-like protein/PAS domain S-box-containing protein